MSKNERSSRVTVHTTREATTHARIVPIHVTSAPLTRDTMPVICPRIVVGSSSDRRGPNRSGLFPWMAVSSAPFATLARTGLKSVSCCSERPVCTNAPRAC